MNIRKVFLTATLLFLTPFSWGEKAGVIGNFRGLHNSEPSVLINDNEAQDLSNVDLSDTGKTIKKRSGTATYKSVGISTHPVTGGYFFKDVDGDEILVAANDGIVYKSETSGAYASFVTTDTSGAFYDFVDSQGVLWRANSANDEIWSYNGNTLTYYPSHPKGNQIEALPDRLVIAGTAANPNRLNFSGAADFTTFTTGALETDPFYEDIFLPGQDIMAIKAACGGVIAWTIDSMSFWYGTNQYDGEIRQISQNIGTKQPSSIIEDLEVIYWQAQDGHFYGYDCNTITKLSGNLDVSDFVSGSPKSWTQTAQVDWEAGTSIYTTSAITAGDLQPSTWTETDSGASDFASGSTSNTTVIGDRVYLSTNNTNVENNSFESAFGAEWTCSGSGAQNCGRVGSVSTVSPYSGSFMLNISSTNFASDPAGITAYILDSNNNVLSTQSIGTPSSWTQYSFTLSSYVGRWLKIRFKWSYISPSNEGIVTSSSFLCSGSPISFYAITLYEGTAFTNGGFIDLVEGGRSTIYSGTFTGQALNTGFSTGAWLSSGASWTTNNHAVSVQTQSGPDGSTWDSVVAWTTGTAPGSDWDKYIRDVVTLSTGGTTNGTALPYFESATFNARSSSSTFISQTKNIGINATSFGNFSRTETLNGGTIGYFIRTATTEGGLASASWTALTPDSKITATIRPWIQIRSSFTITVATQDPTIHSFTVNWNEGTLTRHWGTTDKNHRLMWSVAEGADTYPSVSYIFDQRFQAWLKYSFPFYAPARSGDNIYYGSPSAGTVSQYPSGTSDSGSAITAYWKSKDFIGNDPFIEKDFNSWSFIANTQTGSNLDVTYTVDTTSTTVEAESLTDPNSVLFRRRNEHFPSGTFGTFINFKFGNDDLDAPFELFGFSFDFDPRPWRVLE